MKPAPWQVTCPIEGCRTRLRLPVIVTEGSRLPDGKSVAVSVRVDQTPMQEHMKEKHPASGRMQHGT